MLVILAGSAETDNDTYFFPSSLSSSVSVVAVSSSLHVLLLWPDPDHIYGAVKLLSCCICVREVAVPLAVLVLLLWFCLWGFCSLVVVLFFPCQFLADRGELWGK